MKPKILVQIALMEDGSVTCQSTSKNKLTSLGLIEMGSMLMANSLREAEPSNIIVPDVN